MTTTLHRWSQADLAPGDSGARRLDVSGLVMRSPRSVDDPAFAAAYQFLAGTFGRSGALERVAVLAQRLAWPDGPQADGWTLKYELLSITDAAGNLAAVRDHTAVVAPGRAPDVIVHLSHVLVAPAWRRSGIGGWLRALPLQLARDCVGTDAARITLVAEMETAPPSGENRPASLLAYEHAGFRKLDPARVPYFQPDFRMPAEIDHAGGPRPLPFSLVLRQVGREHETDLDGATARSIARALYRIYRDGCDPRHLAPWLAQIETDYPQPGERIQLVPPTAA